MQWLDQYGESPSKTTVVGFVFTILYTFGGKILAQASECPPALLHFHGGIILGPLSGYLSDKYSMQTARCLVFCGGLLFSLSMIASGCMTHIKGVIVFFAVIPGEVR